MLGMPDNRLHYPSDLFPLPLPNPSEAIMGFGPSFPQVELFKMVKAIYPDAQLEYRLGNRRLDIAIPSRRIDIEYDGALFHADPLKDAQRDLEVSSKGWRVIRIRASDFRAIKENPNVLRLI